MARRRETGGARRRGAVWWIHYRVDGVRYHESAATGDEREARSLLAQRRREIRDGTWRPPTERAAERTAEILRARLDGIEATQVAMRREALTVASWAETWIARRRRDGVRGVTDEAQRLRVFVLPRIGERALVTVKRADVRDAIAAVSQATSEKTGQPYAPRTVRAVYAVVRTMFADAVAEELLEASPCTLQTRRGELPSNVDADPEWRGEAIYTRAEAEALLSSELVPEDRRVLYALQLFGGLRIGEAIARRWRDFDTEATPLGRMTVWSQVTRDGTERVPKNGKTRAVPIHPELARVLAAWRLGGFAKFTTRVPTPDDFVVPSRFDLRSARRRSKTLAALNGDLGRLGLRSSGRGQHAMRATFLTLLESDGANMAIASKVTHAARPDVVTGYIRTAWPELCREVTKLRLEVVRGKVAARRIARAHGAPDSPIAGDSGGDSETLSIAEPQESRPCTSTASRSTTRPPVANPANNRAISEGALAEAPRKIPRFSESPTAEVQTVTHCHRGAAARGVEILRELGHVEEADAVEVLLEGSG